MIGDWITSYVSQRAGDVESARPHVVHVHLAIYDLATCSVTIIGRRLRYKTPSSDNANWFASQGIKSLPKAVILAEARENRLCELVDGTLVEHAMAFEESRLAAKLIHDSSDKGCAGIRHARAGPDWPSRRSIAV
jgi:hypothetical protein